MSTAISVMLLMSLFCVAIVAPLVHGWIPSASRPRSSHTGGFAFQATAASNADTTTYKAVFDFGSAETIDKFDRLDDAIMGGISTSALRADSDGLAKWSGVCRTDGG